MNTFSKIAVGAVAAAGLSLAAVALGASPGMGHGKGGGPGMGMHGGHGAGVETNLSTLKSELKLTGNQTKAWDAFETAVRGQAKTMTDMHTSMQAGQHNPDAHIAIMEQHLAGMKTVHKARTDFYNVLTPEQKAVFDRTGPHNHRE